MLEITVNIPGLKELAEAILAVKKADVAPAQQQATPPEIPVQQPQPVVQASVSPQVPTAPAQAAPAVQAAPVTPAAPVQTSVPNYTLNDLATAAMTLMDSGRQAELQQLLTSFGVDSLPALAPEQYGAFATALRQKGAQI